MTALYSNNIIYWLTLKPRLIQHLWAKPQNAPGSLPTPGLSAVINGNQYALIRYFEVAPASADLAWERASHWISPLCVHKQVDSID